MNEIKYSDRQVCVMVDMFFREHARPTPWRVIKDAMGEDAKEASLTSLERYLWGVVTGYAGNKAAGPRRTPPVRPHASRAHRSGRHWYQREDAALRLALAGTGQDHDPPCDAEYMAAVLARTVAEVENRWTNINKDPLGREGFGFGCRA